MRVLALLAAITMMHTALALPPRPDLAVRQDGNDLRNESHVFHHLDRNQRTADRDRERPYRNEARRSPNGQSIARSVSERPQRAGAPREAVVERRFMRNPDYSEGDGSRGGLNSAPDTKSTQRRPTKAEKERTSMGDP